MRLRRRLRGLLFLLMASWVIYLTLTYFNRDQGGLGIAKPVKTSKDDVSSLIQIFRDIDFGAFAKQKTIAIAKMPLTRATELRRDMFVESAPYVSDLLIPQGAVAFNQLDQFVARYKITEESLERLQTENIPPNVLGTLQDVLRSAGNQGTIATQASLERLQAEDLPPEVLDTLKNALQSTGNQRAVSIDQFRESLRLDHLPSDVRDKLSGDLKSKEGREITFEETLEILEKAFKETQGQEVIFEKILINTTRLFKSITNQEFANEQDLVDYLKLKIGEKLTEEYKDLILKHARHPGHFLLAPLQAGQPLLSDKLHFDRQRLIEDRTAVDMRAMSVKVNEVIGVAGFIKPYSWVDVLTTLTTRKETVTVLRGVMVLAVNELGERKKNEERGVAKPNVVTLQVTPAQAEKLALAANEGRLSLSLRNPRDIELGKTPGVRISGLRSGPQGPVESVTIIRGTKKQIQTFRKK